MASPTFSSSTESIYNSAKLFKISMVKHLKWNKLDWNTSGYNDTKFSRFVSFVKYWNSILKESFSDNTLILTLYHDSVEPYLDLDDVLEAVSQFISLDKIVGYFNLKSPKLIGLELDSLNTKILIMEKLLMVKEYFVSFLEWVPIDNKVNMTIHWLPPSISQTKVSDSIKKYMEILSIDFEKNDFKKKKKFKSGKYLLKGTLLSNFQLSDIPHFLQFGYIQALVVIKGRPPICLSCLKEGHYAAHCPTPYCRNCRKKLPVKHVCMTHQDFKFSFAEMAKKHTVHEEDDPGETWADMCIDSENDATYFTNISDAKDKPFPPDGPNNEKDNTLLDNPIVDSNTDFMTKSYNSSKTSPLSVAALEDIQISEEAFDGSVIEPPKISTSRRDLVGSHSMDQPDQVILMEYVEKPSKRKIQDVSDKLSISQGKKPPDPLKVYGKSGHSIMKKSTDQFDTILDKT